MKDLEHEKSSLASHVEKMIKDYVAVVKVREITNLHDMLLEQIEPPLLEAVMERCRYNQCKAATILGLSRGTLRMKLIKYFNDKYCGRREEKASYADETESR